MNWLTFTSFIAISCIGVAQILYAINFGRYSNMVWELDAALADLEGRVSAIDGGTVKK